MIDIHSHILPGIDDGSDSLRTTIEMLSMASAGGSVGIVATPHCNIPGLYENYASEKLLELWRRIRNAAKQVAVPIRIYAGMEIFATDKLPDLLKSGKAWTLNGTKNFLTEFSFDEDPDFCMDVLADCVKLGYRPVIAHPERYYFVQNDPNIAFEWCRSGYALQINKESLLGRFGSAEERTALALVEHGLAACVASDAHGVEHRSTNMMHVRRFLEDRFGKTYAKILFDQNPARLLGGQDLLGYEITPFGD